MLNVNILLVDNYDSFTFNLQHLIAKQPGVSLTVVRNDQIDLQAVDNKKYDAVVIGPGPGSPEDEAYFGLNKTLIEKYGLKGLPILGICLGFQGIFHCFGGELKVSDLPMHGKVSALEHCDATPLLADVPESSEVMRYHAIMLDTHSTPKTLKITARAKDPIEGPEPIHQAMALEHRDYPIYGLQFHPESFATENGGLYIKNFLAIVRSSAWYLSKHSTATT